VLQVQDALKIDKVLKNSGNLVKKLNKIIRTLVWVLEPQIQLQVLYSQINAQDDDEDYIFS
jgi:hypothetical protein